MVLTEIAASAQTVLTGARAEFRRLYLKGRFAEARRLAGSCYELGRDRVAWVTNLALVAMEQGNLREAYSLYLTHAELLPDCEDDYSVANFNLGYGIVSKRLYSLHRSEEYFDHASIAFTAASFHFERAGSDSCVAYAENCFANLLIVANRPAEAFRHVDVAQLFFNDAGERARVADCEDTRALALEALGRTLEAYECAHRAFVMLLQCGESEAKSIKQVRETLERVYAKLTGGMS